MLDGALIECNRPVGIVFSNRCGNIEPIRQLYIDCHITVRIEVGGKITLISRIVNQMVIQMPLYFHDVRTEFSFQGRLSENVCIVMFIQNIVGDMLDDGRCLFVIDEGSCFQDELFRVILELIEHRFFNADQNLYNRLAGQLGFSHQLANQVILDALTGVNFGLWVIFMLIRFCESRAI